MPSTQARVISVSLMDETSNPEMVLVYIRAGDGQTLTWQLPINQAPAVGTAVTVTVTAS